MSPLPSWVDSDRPSQRMEGLAAVLDRVRAAVVEILDTTSIEVLVHESPSELDENVRTLMYHI